MVNTQCISRVPPQRAKPKGRNMTQLEKKQVTLGAKGEKKGTRRCSVCRFYTTHNSRTCPTLEHNQQRLEAMRNKKRGRPPGAKNKRALVAPVHGSDGWDIRAGKRQKLMASPSDAEFEDETESGDEIDVEESSYCTEDDE